MRIWRSATAMEERKRSSRGLWPGQGAQRTSIAYHKAKMGTLPRDSPAPMSQLTPVGHIHHLRTYFSITRTHRNVRARPFRVYGFSFTVGLRDFLGFKAFILGLEAFLLGFQVFSGGSIF